MTTPSEQNIEEKFDELMFASCPTEEKEPFFWRWTEQGKTRIIGFIKGLLAHHEQEVLEAKVKEVVQWYLDNNPDRPRQSEIVALLRNKTN